MEKPFNATFFATVAVILPVVFLALALQSDYLAQALLASDQLTRTTKRRWSEAEKRQSKAGRAMSLDILAHWFSSLVFLLVVLVMAFGIWGEILALVSLEQRQAMLETQSTVLVAAIALIVAAAIASVWRLVETLIEADRSMRKSDPTGPEQPAVLSATPADDDQAPE